MSSVFYLKNMIIASISIILHLLLARCQKFDPLSSNALAKPKKLSILVFIPFTGLQPRDGKTCQAATEIVARVVNARRDILPDYSIEFDYQDEGSNSVQVVKKSIDFTRKFPRKDRVLQSPVTIGPYFTAGCNRYGSIVHYLNMVTVATGCQSPFFTANRGVYPNMYRMRVTGELVVHPWIQFMKKVGKWQTLAILTWSGNLFGYSIATTFYEAALASNLTVVWFNSPADMDDGSIQSLKDSEARIIALPIGEVGVVFKFFCQAHKFGLEGSKFAFLALTKAYTDPLSIEQKDVPSGCSKAILMEQTKITFWAGEMYSAAFNYGPTTLGYDLEEFELVFDVLTNNSRTADYDRRHQCHDAALQAVLTLDQTERHLKPKNLSLSDFPTHPEIIMTVANETAPKIEYHGLRTGNVRYSYRAELDDEPQCVAQQQNRTLEILYLVTRNATTGLFEMRFNFQPAWMSENGTPPKDLIILQRNLVELDIISLGAIVGLFLLNLLTHSAAIVWQIVQKFKNKEYSKRSLWISKICLTLGCILLDFAAAFFAIPKQFFGSSSVRCFLRPIFLVFGLDVLAGYFLFRLLLSSKQGASGEKALRSFLSSSYENFKRRRRVNREKPRRTRKFKNIIKELSSEASSSIELSLHVKSVMPDHSNQSVEPQTARKVARNAVYRDNPLSQSFDEDALHEFFVLVNTLAFSLINGALLVAWFLTERGSMLDEMFNLDTEPIYNPNDDTYHQHQIWVCSLKKGLTFPVILAALNCIALCFGSFVAYQLRRGSKSSNDVPELKQTRLGVLNATTLVIATIFIMFIIQNSPVLQQIIISAATLVISLVTTLVVFYPSVFPPSPEAEMTNRPGTLFQATRAQTLFRTARPSMRRERPSKVAPSKQPDYQLNFDNTPALDQQSNDVIYYDQ